MQLTTPELPNDLDKINVATTRVANRANLDLLESVGRSRDFGGRFWRDLISACDMLGLKDRTLALVTEFRAALQHVGRPSAEPFDPDT